MKVKSLMLSTLWYTVDTYSTFNQSECLYDSWFEESDTDNEGFMQDLAKLHVDTINSVLPAGPVKSVTLVETTSPKEYNFATDQAELEIDVDMDALLDWAHKHENLIDEFAKEHFTSRDGFWSYTPNSFKEIMAAIDRTSVEYYHEYDHDKCVAILVGLYLTEEEILTEEDYMDQMWEGFSEIAWENFKQFTDATYEEYYAWREQAEKAAILLEYIPDIEEWYREYKEKKDDSSTNS
jgi:hypothetical protein